MRVNQEDRRITGFRKQIIFIIGTIGTLASLAILGVTFLNQATLADQFGYVLATGIAQLVCCGLLVGLALRNNLTLAAGWFSIFVPALITVRYILLPDSNIYFFYALALVVSAALTGPIATIIYGLTLTLLYAITSVLLITAGALESDLVHWANIAIFSGIFVGLTGVLYGFGDSLGRVLRSSRQQNEEMRRLNARLQGQRQLESQIATQVADLTRILSQVSQEQNEISRRQSHIINDVATTTQQLDAAARRIADNALSVATVAEKAQKSVEVGQQAAFQGVNSIGAMRERVQDINENMQSLITQLERINEVIGIIGEIADETNLLALNATIEAAGAREYGRRFAAVADEVQRLARRATNAVEQIQDMVEEINDAGAKTMAATEQGLQEAQLGDKLVTSLTAANDDVINLVAQTSNLATNIAGSTQQQREASAQIVELINDITQVSQTMIQATTEVNQIVHELEDSSARLLSADLTAPVLPSEESRVGRALRHFQAIRRARPALGSPLEGEPELIVEGTTR